MWSSSPVSQVTVQNTCFMLDVTLIPLIPGNHDMILKNTLKMSVFTVEWKLTALRWVIFIIFGKQQQQQQIPF